MLNIFTHKYDEKSESFNDLSMSNFLSDKEILRWESHFFEHKKEFFWSVLVEYRASIPSQTGMPQKTEGSKDESYKELLKENDWPLFKVLREWRGELSKKEGIPPYIICNNIQLAKITVMRPSSLNALQEIEGIGKAKTEKYGKEILEKIASFGKTAGAQEEIKNG
jgi:superfamily II DNA helicase RecQ